MTRDSGSCKVLVVTDSPIPDFEFGVIYSNGSDSREARCCSNTEGGRGRRGTEREREVGRRGEGEEVEREVKKTENWRFRMTR